ncbi:MAG: aldolase [Hyphomicrobiaceae bacterium]|nr:aldolase [Hyphomicrobiaceae bacterium]
MADEVKALIHATAIARGGACVLLRGESGSGKSDLALRLLALRWADGLPIFPEIGETNTTADAVFRLVSDDQVILRREGEGIIASAPATIAGKMEVRGIGIVDVPTIASARVVLVVELVVPDAVPRMPEHHSAEILGVVLPLVRLTPFELSAPIKVALALASAAAELGQEARSGVSRAPSA